MIDKIKTILIDIDNTLLDFHKSSALSIKYACKEFKIKYSKKLVKIFLFENEKLWKMVENQQLDRDTLHNTRWNIVFGKIGIKVDGILFEKTFRKNLFNCAVRVSGAKKIIRYLSKKYYICTASNGPQLQQEHRLSVGGIDKYIDKVFTSEGLGKEKPDILFFERLSKNLDNFDKNECVLIGDSLSADIKGGKDFGIKTIWFNMDKQDVNHGDFDYKVNKLSEIKKIL